MDDLVKRLREFAIHTPLSKPMLLKAADRIEALEARIAKADALADAFEDFNAKIDKARAPVGSARIAAIEALQAYREGSDT